MAWPLEKLRERLGGSWDGDDTQAHGRIDVGGRALKVEMTLTHDLVRCQIFEDGVVIAHAEDALVARALGLALRQV